MTEAKANANAAKGLLPPGPQKPQPNPTQSLPRPGVISKPGNSRLLSGPQLKSFLVLTLRVLDFKCRPKLKSFVCDSSARPLSKCQ